VAGDHLLGTLSFASRSKDEFSADEAGFLETICHYVTAAFGRIDLVRQLREADRRKDEFLAILAHELRNPLAPIRSGLDVMKLAGDDAATVAEVRVIMDRQVNQITRLIDDLLDVSRISRGKLQLHQVPVELGEVVATAVAAARPQIDEARHDFRMELPRQPLCVYADPQRMVQVLANLLWNAAKYTPAQGRIVLSAEPLDGRVALKVRDTGIGIAPEMRESIFEMFRQGDRSGNGGAAGLGIGLTLVKSLVEMHGGTISVKSEGPGKGSEFCVELPLSTLPPPARRRDSSPEMPVMDPSRRRIMVVDDNTAALTTLRKSIELLGHDVRVASDGEEALRVAEEFRPELVFMDIAMPRTNGYEAARRIRRRPWGRDVVLVALSGHGLAADKERARAAGFDHHVTKPGEKGAVQRLIRDLEVAQSCEGRAS
jgi:signal transduction histidine kinase/CheY-like chemotaxis protein